MNCNDCQNRLSELLDAGGDPPLDPLVERHVADCASCREFRAAWITLDARLVRHAATAALPSDFKATLLARLPALRPRLTPAEVAVRRAECEREYLAALARLQRQYPHPEPALLRRVLLFVGGCVLAGLALVALTRYLPTALELALRFFADPWMLALFGAGIGLVAALYGLRRAGLPRLVWRH